MSISVATEVETWEGFDCFGYYSGGAICASCPGSKRCKAVLVTNGFDVVASMVNHLTSALTDTAVFMGSDRVPDLVDQLLNPGSRVTTKEEDELLALFNSSRSGDSVVDLL